MPRRPRLGQHFLIDPRVAERIIGYAQLRGDETVLEIGPGRGVLTRVLAERAARVVAIEKDAEMVDELEDAGLPANVEVILGDARKVDLPAFDKVVANLPFAISSAITFRLLEHRFEMAVLTFQREFAQRLSAKPGAEEYGRLTVNAFVKAEIEALEPIPARAFQPPPKVSSMVVRLRPRAQPPFPMADPQLFAEVVRAAFQHRRKTLRNALLDQWPALAAERAALAGAVGSLPRMERRAGSLTPQEFNDVAEALAKHGLRPSEARA